MEIEYFDEHHLYLIDGVITPSVSKILKFIFPDKYSGIPKSILESKATFGNNIHKAIEDYEQGREVEINKFEQIVFDQYLRIKDKYGIEVLDQEIMVHYKQQYAGRLDMIANVGGVKTLIDTKTTATIDREMLEWQLGMYKLAYKGKVERHCCLWLPKKKLGDLIAIKPKSKKEIITMLEAFNHSNEK